MENTRWKDVFADWMPLIDQRLSNDEVPIPDRPFKAAWLFVRWAVVQVGNDTGTEAGFVEKPWFAPIHRETSAWYREKYGHALERPDDFLLGVCLHNGSTLELHIPRTLRRVEKEDETSWLIFPLDIQEEDNPESWIVRPPNLAAMTSREKRPLLTKVIKIGTCLRAIYLDLMTADRPDRVGEGLANNILPHLRISATYLLESQQRSLNLACWETHQAVEKSLKLLSRQQNASHI